MNENERKLYPIKSSEETFRIFKKLSGQYPESKKSRFISDLSKNEDTKVSLKILNDNIDRYTKILKYVQKETSEDRYSKKFINDKRVKILCNAINLFKKIKSEILNPPKEDAFLNVESLGLHFYRYQDYGYSSLDDFVKDACYQHSNYLEHVFMNASDS